MTLKKFKLVAALFAATFVSASLSAEENKAERKPKDTAFVPFYFSTETLGNSFGVASVMKGVGQSQAVLFGMGLYTSKESYVGFLSALNYAISDNWLASTQLYQAQFNQNPYYIGDQGNNDSDPLSEGTITNGLENRYEATFRYLLPWGAVRNDGLMGVFKPNREVSFASPVDSGISSISFTPFYSSRDLDIDNDRKQSTGVEIAFDWDNRDNSRNTTKGSHTRLDITLASEELGDFEPWVKLEFQNSHYFDIGPLGDLFDKQVLAFDFYTADTPTWDAGYGEEKARPPEHEQVRLGGLYRLRSYTGGRYHGRSAIHYSAEYRVLPDWQPLDDIPIINYYDLPWWQWVAFADVGRVADEYNLKTLHSDMKWSVGGAVRFQVEGIVVRTEIARGSDESLFRVMINQPF